MPQKGSTDLFRLIRSLDRTEKAYFKKFAERHVIGEKNHYLKLFDAIDAQQVYDEAKLIREEKYIKQLPYLKNYLFDLIMKSMNVYHAGSSGESRMENTILRIRTLYRKGLYDICLKMIGRAKKEAMDHQYFQDALKLIILERRILLESGKKLGNKKTYDQLHALELQCLRYDTLVSQYAALEDELVFRTWEIGKKRRAAKPSDFRDIMENELLRREPKEFPFRARILFYNIHSLYNKQIGNLEQHYRYASKHKVEKQREYQQFGDVLKYIICLNNYYLSCFFSKRYSRCAEVLEEMRSLPVRSLKEEEAVYSRYLIFRSGLYVVTGDFSAGAQFVKQYSQIYERIRPIMKPSRNLTYVLSNFHNYFGNRNYKECLKWVSVLITPASAKLNREIYCHGIILNIMLHYELENYELLPYLIKSADRYFTSHKLKKPFETIMLRLFSGLTKAGGKESVLFRQAQAELEQAFHDDFYREVIVGYFDYPSWIESKISNRTFAQVVAARLK